MSLFAQETTQNHHIFFASEIGSGYSTWRARTTDGNYKRNGPNFNLNLTPYYNYKNLMLGISYGYERLMVDTLIKTTDNSSYGTGYKNNNVSINKVSLVLGYNIIKRKKITMGASAHVGTFRLDKSFDKKLIKKKLVANIGLDLSYNTSDRVALFIQPNFEYKYYILNPDLIGGLSVNHRITTFNCFLGVNYKIL